MNVLIAPNSLKDAANAAEIAGAIEEGLLNASSDFKIRKHPIADGGEYTLEILLASMGGEITEVETLDPLGRPISAIYGITKDNTAIVELAKASGFEGVVNTERNPLLTSTYGSGIQIKDAISRGCKTIILTLGGSITVDGGAGILEALGISLLDTNKKQLPRGGGNLILLNSFDTENIISASKEVSFTLLCDVKNPLLGAEGAAMIFAPQKGASQIETMILERCLAKFGALCEAHSGKKLIRLEGAGAAGGVAVGIKAFFKTKMLSGIEYIYRIQKTDKHIKWADFVITAEGSLDSQTFGGKAPAFLAQKAKEAGKKTICIAGSIPHRANDPDTVFDAVFSLQNKPMTLEESIENTLVNVKNTAFEIGRLIMK